MLYTEDSYFFYILSKKIDTPDFDSRFFSGQLLGNYTIYPTDIFQLNG